MRKLSFFWHIRAWFIVILSILTVDKKTAKWMLETHKQMLENYKVDYYRPWVIRLVRLKMRLMSNF